MREVAVLGVGMTPFAARSDISLREQFYRSGREALDDAGVAFPSVGSVYIGYLWEPVMLRPYGPKRSNAASIAQ